MIQEEDIIFAITKQNVWKVTTTILLILVIAFIIKDETKGSSSPSAKTDIDYQDDDAVLGDPNAPVTVVEFSDFECPYCKKAYEDSVKQLKTEYVSTGKVKFVYRDYPLGFHPKAQKAAEASECAHEQNKFWEMHDKLFENQASLSEVNYKKWATELGMDSNKFNDCLDTGKYANEVAADTAAGNALGVSGTPTFFVNGQKIVGAVPYAQLKQVVDSYL